MEPVSVKSLVVEKSLLPQPGVFGSIDRGASLTKLLYKKSIADDPDRVSLQMAFYRNCDFEKAIDWLVERIAEEGAQGQKLHLTGVGGDKYRHMIEERTGLKSENINEVASQNAGCHFLVKNFDEQKFCYEEETAPAGDDAKKPPEWIAKFIEKELAVYKENIGKRLPVLVAYCGSVAGINVVYEDKMEVLGASMFSGKSMLGMSKLIVGTNDYNELMELADKGRRNNVDTESGEILAQQEKPQVPGMPPNVPIIPFGKASERDADNFVREDLAAGVVGTVITSLIAQITVACKLKGIPKVFIGGNMFASKVAREMFNAALVNKPGVLGVLKFRFLSVGHTGCIGALLLTPEQAEKYRHNLEVK